MTRILWTAALALAVGGCSAAGGGGEDDPALQQKLQALKTENAKLDKQVRALGSRAFDRASKVEKKRKLKGKTRVLRGSAGSLRFDALVLGPLKFKKKIRSFYLNIGAGTKRGGIEDHESSLSTGNGKKVKSKAGKRNVIIHKKGGK